MIYHENRLPAEDSHEILFIIVFFEKATKFEIVVCCKLYLVCHLLSLEVSAMGRLRYMGVNQEN